MVLSFTRILKVRDDPTDGIARRVVSIAVGAHEGVDVYVSHPGCPGLIHAGGDAAVELVSALEGLDDGEGVPLVHQAVPVVLAHRRADLLRHVHPESSLRASHEEAREHHQHAGHHHQHQAPYTHRRCRVLHQAFLIFEFPINFLFLLFFQEGGDEERNDKKENTKRGKEKKEETKRGKKQYYGTLLQRIWSSLKKFPP